MIKHIIATRFMQHNLGKYHRIVEDLEASETFQTWLRTGHLTIFHYPHDPDGCGSTTLGRLTVDGFRFACPHLAVTYSVEIDLPINSTWHVMRHVTQRNRATARILRLIAERQRAFLHSTDPLDLQLYPYDAIIHDYRIHWNRGYIDTSVISRVVRNKNVLLPDNRKTALGELLPLSSLWLGYRIERLARQNDAPLTDVKLAEALETHFGVRFGPRYVGQCRRKMGIPPARFRRRGNSPPIGPLPDHWQPFDKNMACSLSKAGGVYELSSAGKTFCYPHGESPTVYIGCTRSLRTRLAAYLNGYAHSEVLRRLLADGMKIEVRTAIVSDFKRMEARLMHGFESRFGALPLANKLKPRLK